MPRRKQREGSPAERLTTDRVVREAVAMADRGGVAGLSMRGLAGRLDAGPMSLYHYVSNKDDLLDAMVDALYGEIERPTDDEDWQAAIRRVAHSARQVLVRHPWALALMESRTSPGPANLHHHEAVTACLRRAGFSVVAATHASWFLDSYVYGHALQEASLPFGSSEEFAEMSEAVYLPQLPPDLFPFLNESAAVLAASGYDPAAEFGIGLDLVLTALESLRRAGR